MKKFCLLIFFTLFFLFSGCRAAERMEPPEETAPPMTESGESLALPSAEETMSEAETEVGESEPEETIAATALTVEGFIGECTYTVDSWAVYESWADAGISEDALSSNYPVDSSGILLVTLTQHCDSRSEMSQGQEYMTVGAFQPLAQAQVDAAQQVADLQKYLYIDTDIASPACYFDQAQTGQREYFYCPVLNEGEAVTYTLGFVLSETTRAAAEEGTLLLWYTTNGVPATADELLLLALR